MSLDYHTYGYGSDKPLDSSHGKSHRSRKHKYEQNISQTSERKHMQDYSTVKSVKRRILDEVDPRDPIYHLAQCLFYTVHLQNVTSISNRLGSGGPQMLVLKMYESEKVLRAEPMEYLNQCYLSFLKVLGDHFSFNYYVELILNKFLDLKLIRKMGQTNYTSLFTSVFNKACASYIADLSANVKSLYVYDDPAVYKAICVEFFKKRIVTAFEVTVHTMVDDSPENVPRLLYEQVKSDRDRLAKKCKRLKHKYKKLKRELEDE
jgi:hypothetical protein